MNFESSLFIWLLPLALLAAEWLVAWFVSFVNDYRRVKRAKRVLAAQTALGDPWPAEPRALKNITEFIEEACMRLRPGQRNRRAEMLDKEMRGDPCGS